MITEAEKEINKLKIELIKEKENRSLTKKLKFPWC